MGRNSTRSFGVDESSSAHWAYVWGIKGRWDERKKLEGDIEVDKETLNEEARGHYHDEIEGEIQKLNGYLPEGAAPLYIPHENFNREIGTMKGKRFFTDGTEFTGSDDEWTTYVREHLPTPEDEAALIDLFKQQWVAEKPLTTKQIESGIGNCLSGDLMIPVSLYGVDAEMCERFYDALPTLVDDAYEDQTYIDALYAIQDERSIEHIRISDMWSNRALMLGQKMSKPKLKWSSKPFHTQM